jgi:4-phosphopantoate--beta-alanine ligase
LKIEIPPSHPRYKSLLIREKLVEGFEKGLVVPQGLIAQGRGEAFDYLIGEKTESFAVKAIEAAAALLLLSEKPVISVNGNATALVGEELVDFSNASRIPLEINLFYRTEERVNKIRDYLLELGAKYLYWQADGVLPGLESNRRLVATRGILSADTVLVMLEDGDRTEALRRLGKNVIAVDLNPLSRTSLAANITIVDNVVRAVPLLKQKYFELSKRPREVSKQIITEYDNRRIISESLDYMSKRLRELVGNLLTQNT